MEKEERQEGLLTVTIRYSNSRIKWLWIAIILLGLVCAACNIVLPLIERAILEMVSDSSSNPSVMGVSLTQWQYLVCFLCITIFSALLLALENILNVKVLYAFRQRLEEQSMRNLAAHRAVSSASNGHGFLSASLLGDSNQVASMIAANYVAMFLNVVSAIVSMIISAQWYLPFFLIALVSYAAILVIIFVFARLEVSNFRKGMVASYKVNPKILELIDCHDTILDATNYVSYIESLRPAFHERNKYEERAGISGKLGQSLIKMVQGVALAVFLMIAVTQGIGDGEGYALSYATFVALISYLGTIFLPVDSLSEAWTSRNKFKAFYGRLRELLSQASIGQLPATSDFNIKHLGIKGKQGEWLCNGFDFKMNKNVAVVGLTGDGEKAMISAILGDLTPNTGQVLLGDVETNKIRKSLILSTLRYQSDINGCFDNGLEYNLCLGRPLLSDDEYREKLADYTSRMVDFFYTAKQGTMFKIKNRRQTKVYLEDLLAIEPSDYQGKVAKEVVATTFASVNDFNTFVESVAPCIFSGKYVKRSRYESIIDELGLHHLENKEFGPRAMNLSDSDKQLIVLARFLLPEDDADYILNDPVDKLDPLEKNRALEVLRRYLKNPEKPMHGVILSNDLNAARYLSDRIYVAEEGTFIASGEHAELMDKSPRYQALWDVMGKHVAKKTRSKQSKKKETKNG